MDIRLLCAEKETDVEMHIAWTNRSLGFLQGFYFFHIACFYSFTHTF